MAGLVLVTGADGFIGSHLVEELVSRGVRPRALVHYDFRESWGWLDAMPRDVLARVEVVAADVRDPYAVRKAVEGCSTVFHLAALIGIPYSYTAPSSYVDTNVKGTLHILQASLDEKVDLVVHTSTSETYGTAQYVPIDERHPLVAQSPYAASKIAADKLAEAFHLSFGLPVATVRPFNTFGPRQSNRAVIPTIATQALSGAEEIRLGSLHPIRDFTYVKDTVAGFLAVAQCQKAIGRVTNIGNGKGISVGELAQLILDACGSSARILHSEERMRPAESEILRLICDNTWAVENVGWRPRYALRDALTETVSWLRSHLAQYKTGRYTV